MTGGIRMLYPLLSPLSVNSEISSPKELTLEIIPFDLALKLNKLWHSRLPRMGTGAVKDMKLLSFAAHKSGFIYAIAIWSNPVARNLPQREWLELRRLAISSDAPRFTASWMLGVMAKKIRKIKPEIRTLVSYQDTEVHVGTIYRAANWKPTTINKDGEWNRPSRRRPAAQSFAPKQRWEYHIETKERDRL